jgi:prepilin signal peptidase PulO-like enzyme (type II secretory pathway)
MFFSIQPINWPSIVIVLVFLTPIIIIDLKSYIIPDHLVFSGVLVLLVYFAFSQKDLFYPGLLYGALSFSVIFVFWLLFKKQIGLGDAKLSFFLGAGLGFLEWWGVLFIASLCAMTYGLIKIKQKKMTMKDKLPLAPFFGIGTVVVILLKLILLSLKLE